MSDKSRKEIFPPIKIGTENNEDLHKGKISCGRVVLIVTPEVGEAGEWLHVTSEGDGVVVDA